MHKRIKVRSSKDDVIKSFTVWGRREWRMPLMDEKPVEHDSNVLGGVIVGSGLTLLSDGCTSPAYLSIDCSVENTCFSGISAAPVLQKEYVERSEHEQLVSDLQCVKAENAVLSTRLNILENMVRSADARIEELTRKVIWGSNSVMQQLEEVRGDQFRYIY